jgi:Bacteriocin-protection, YdeI or OmpD-Associated/Domain of unknown function (DUF1905)
MKLPTPKRINSMTIRFSTQLFQPKTIRKKGLQVLLTLPKKVQSKLRPNGVTAIEGIIDGFPFQTTIKAGSVCGWVPVNKTLHSASYKDGGKKVNVEITRIADEPETRIPTDFRKALALKPIAQDLWKDITPIARRDWIFWIISAKQEKTRAHRIETACSKLSTGKRRVCCFGGVAWLMKQK